MQHEASNDPTLHYQALIDQLSPLLSANPDVVISRLKTVLPKSAKPSGVFKLALASDFLRTIQRISEGKCVVSKGPLKKAAPWVCHCAQLFHRTGRRLYDQFQAPSLSELDHFLQQHQRDTDLFGGQCHNTEWSGFSIVRASAILLKEVKVVDRYEEYIFSWQNPEFDSSDGISGTWIIKQLIQDAKVMLRVDPKCSHIDSKKQKATSNVASEIAVAAAFTERQFHVEFLPLQGPALFEIRESEGALRMVINCNHPLADSLRILLRNNANSQTGLQKLFHAWARLENSSGDTRRRLLEDVRYDWGRFAREVSGEDESA